MSFGDRSIVLGPGEGKTIQVPGHPITYKVVGADNNGAYSLLEAEVAGDGPPQHIHKAEEEAFYVLEGELNIQVGERTIKGTAGSFVLIPRGIAHTFWKAEAEPVKLLVIFSPAGFEQFFVEAVGDEEEMDTPTYVNRAISIAEKYNLDVIGPPLG